MTIGAQLYTVHSRLATKADIQITMQEIKTIGYETVQLYGEMDFMESCTRYAQQAGLRIVGVLADMNFCETNEQELFDFCTTHSIPDVGISSAFSEYQDPDRYIARVHRFAEKARAAGLTFSYHNHGHEFIRLSDGTVGMKHFLEKFDPLLVDFMPDTYWLQDGGYDIRYFLEQTNGRVKLLHLKDWKRLELSHTFAEIGNGNLCFKEILKTAAKCGVEHYIVEQDECPDDPIESLRISYQFLKTLL